MSKPYNNLPEALKGIISENGKEIIEDVKLVNILSDLCSLDDIPVAKTIIKKILSDGYGKDIIVAANNPSWEIKLRMLSSKIANQNGYREDVTLYIIASFAYGLGMRESVPNKVVDASKPSGTITDLKIELKKLKGEFLSFIEDNVVVFDDKPASFQTDDKSEIYEYREKIKMLSALFSNADPNWCDDKINEVIDNNTPKPKKVIVKGFFKRLFG